MKKVYLLCFFFANIIQPQISKAQSLDKASTIQLEFQIRQVVTQLSKDLSAYIANPSEDEALEQAMKGLMKYVQNPSVKVFSDIVEDRRTQTVKWIDYLRNARAYNSKDPSLFLLKVDQNSFKRKEVSIDGDSISVEIFFTETTAKETIPMSVFFSGRIKKNENTNFGYFTRLKINGSKRIDAPNDAIAFSPSTVNPHTTFEDEQSLSTIIQKICQQIASKIPSTTKKINLKRFSLSDCGIFDTFAREVNVSIASNIKFNIKSADISSSFTETNEEIYHVEGDYKIDGEYLSFNVKVLDPSLKEISSFSNKTLPLRWFSVNKTSFIPAEYEPTMADKKVIEQNMVSNKLGLEIEATTNKGKDNLMFKQGDLVEVFIKVNKPCDVRILYRQADAVLTLLGEVKIDKNQTNRSISLGSSPCIPPFGRESLIVYASTERFGTLNIEKRKVQNSNQTESYEIDVITNSLEEACRITSGRGLGKLSPTPNSVASDNIAIFTTEK